MDFRKIFDQDPIAFDTWRFRYCDQLFTDLIQYASLDATKTVLEIGPGTGQATEPILKTGCAYTGIELGENLASFMKHRFSSYDNCNIVNHDFETYEFGKERFDLVYSAATIQWIPEAIAFLKAFSMLILISIKNSESKRIFFRSALSPSVDVVADYDSFLLLA